MSSPLPALVIAYEKTVARTMALGHLGVAGCARHSVDPASLPEPDLAEPSSQTKDPHVLCVEVVDTDGAKRLIQLLSPCSHGRGTRMTRELVDRGVHPLDIIIATLDLDTISGKTAKPGVEPRWTFRNAVEWMFWTDADQNRLESVESQAA